MVTFISVFPELTEHFIILHKNYLRHLSVSRDFIRLLSTTMFRIFFIHCNLILKACPENLPHTKFLSFTLCYIRITPDGDTAPPPLN